MIELHRRLAVGTPSLLLSFAFRIESTADAASRPSGLRHLWADNSAPLRSRSDFNPLGLRWTEANAYVPNMAAETGSVVSLQGFSF